MTGEGRGLRMRTMLDISRAKDEELIAKAKQRVCRYPILKHIYNDDFLRNLINRKRNRDNMLLFWLVVDEGAVPVAVRLFKEIEAMLSLFKDDKNFNSLECKLRQWKSIPFKSTTTELEFAAEYFNRGYEIELEPSLPDGFRTSDFGGIKANHKIYFEVKIAYKQESVRNEAILNDLTERCEAVDQPFTIGLTVAEGFNTSQVIPASRFIGQKLRALKHTVLNLPASFHYPESENPAITINVRNRLPEGERGYVGGSTYGGGIVTSWADIRNKIEQGIRQLHPDFPGVVILGRHNSDYTEYDVINALYGDLTVDFYTQPAREVRTGDRIFAKNKNTRCSAVIHYQKSFHEQGHTSKKTVYHNPFAKMRLSPEIFEGENVTQY
jgi:hypothetical protein